MIYPIGKGACWKICRKAIYNYQAKLFIDNSLLSIEGHLYLVELFFIEVSCVLNC